MIKALTLLKRRQGMDVAAFQSYWLTRHVEVVLRLPGIVRYAQSHTRLGGYRNGDPVYDGIAEVWFENIDAMRALPGTAVHDALLEDEDRFIERSEMAMLLTEDRVIKDEPATGCVKNVELLSRKPGMDVEDFQQYWHDSHGPIARKLPALGRYVQSHARLGGYRNGREPIFDGAAITWFPNTDAMRACAASPEYSATRADEENFLKRGKVPVIITDEHIIVA